MGYDLLAGIFFALMLPLVLLGFVAFWAMTSHEREALAELRRAYARARGLTFVEPEGEWPNRTNPAVTWERDATTFRLETMGREARVRTRLSIRPPSALLGALSIAPCDGTRARAPRGLDDPTFLGVYRVRERPGGFAARLLTPEVRRALLGFRQGDSVTLGYRRGKIVLEWPGGERNDARLDEARRLGETIARAVDDAFRAGMSAPRDAA